MVEGHAGGAQLIAVDRYVRKTLHTLRPWISKLSLHSTGLGSSHSSSASLGSGHSAASASPGGGGQHSRNAFDGAIDIRDIKEVG